MKEKYQFYIGWDVGAWNCGSKSKSRDSLVVLDKNAKVIGKAWRGNIREQINKAETTKEWIELLFQLCEFPLKGNNFQIIMAIDTPLGFSEALTDLLITNTISEPIAEHKKNPYLFRQTERLLFERGYQPLSSIKDMIGSQSTKGIHVLAKFAAQIESCGVWTDNNNFKVIEAYPALCRESAIIKKYTNKIFQISDEANSDIKDALVCAVIAYIFNNDYKQLQPPNSETPLKEGWIWTLKK